MISSNPLFSEPLSHLNTWASVIACMLIAISCLLVINRMPRSRCWPEKALLSAIGITGFGVSVSPFFGYDVDPDHVEVAFRVGVAVFAVWMSLPYWRAIPKFDRRRTECGACALRRRCEDSSDATQWQT